MIITYNHEYPRRLRTAFIGAGGHAQRNVYPAFQFAPVDLVAVCDLKLEQARMIARQFGAPRAYDDLAVMLATERPEVVFIVTNYDERGHPRYPALAEACMLAGAHVWIEKPPAATIDEVRRMQEVSERTGRHVAVGLKKMFFPANVRARVLSRLPEFGRITSITTRYPQVVPPEAVRGDARKMTSFLDHFVHPHSLLRYLGGDLDWLFVNRTDHNGGAVVSLRFKSGAVGSLHYCAGIGTQSFLERTEIVGEGASVVVHNGVQVEYYRRPAPDAPDGRLGYGRESDFCGPLESSPIHWEPEFSLGTLHNKALFLLGYAPEIIHFTAGLLEGVGPTFGNLEDALELMRVYEAYRRPDGLIHRIGV